MTDRSCENCRFGKTVSNAKSMETEWNGTKHYSENVVYCHRYPPHLSGKESDDIKMKPYDWCGEHRFKEYEWAD